MKKIACFAAVFVFVGFAKNASAQFKADYDQPNWAPAGQSNPEYYFLPEIDTYYYVPRKQFIYKSGAHWTFSTYLPRDHRDYDLRSGKKVAVSEPGAYRYFAEHKAKYGNTPSNAAVHMDKPVLKSKSGITADKKAG
jgi:hypothetical protein